MLNRVFNLFQYFLKIVLILYEYQIQFLIFVIPFILITGLVLELTNVSIKKKILIYLLYFIFNNRQLSKNFILILNVYTKLLYKIII